MGIPYCLAVLLCRILPATLRVLLSMYDTKREVTMLRLLLVGCASASHEYGCTVATTA